METFENNLEMENITHKNNDERTLSAKITYGSEDCPPENYMNNINKTSVTVSGNICENTNTNNNVYIDKNQIKYSETRKKLRKIDHNINKEDDFFIEPVGEGLFKITKKLERNMETPIKNTAQKQNHIGMMKKTDIHRAITIKNCENPIQYRNPFKLENALIAAGFENIDNAYLLPFNDIRVWFKNREDVNNIVNKDIKTTFGKNAVIRKAGINKKKIAVYGIAKDVTEKELENHLNNQNIECEEIKLVERINGTSKFKTAFITLSNEDVMRGILEKGKIKIGFGLFAVKKYISKKVIQCHRCQKYGHIAKICQSKIEICGFCSESHITKLCPRKMPDKCVNCFTNKPAFHYDCEAKTRAINEIKTTKQKIKINKKKKDNKKDKKTENITEINFEHKKDPKPIKKRTDFTKLRSNQQIDEIFLEIDKKIEKSFKIIMRIFENKITRIEKMLSMIVQNTETVQKHDD